VIRPARPPQDSQRVTVRRWQRFGFDRLYGTADGASVGWVDLDTGEKRIELPELAEVFEHAVEAWRNQHLTASGSPDGYRSAGASDCPARHAVARKTVRARKLETERAWLDLADNPAGAGVRMKAREARQNERVWTLLARVAGLHTDERAWRVGMKGEELVGRELAKLDRRWHVLHSIRIGDNADVDHLVIGPAGVFALNAKHHKYATVSIDGECVMVNGFPQPYLGKSRHEARRVGQLLSDALGEHVAVHGVVVVVNAGHFTIRHQPWDIQLIEKPRLRKWPALRPGRPGSRARRGALRGGSPVVDLAHVKTPACGYSSTHRRPGRGPDGIFAARARQMVIPRGESFCGVGYDPCGTIVGRPLGFTCARTFPGTSQARTGSALGERQPGAGWLVPRHCGRLMVQGLVIRLLRRLLG